MKRPSKYTAEQLEFLRRGYQGLTIEWLARAFNYKFGLKKTETAIRSALHNHRILCNRKPQDRIIRRERLFTREQLQFLRNKYPSLSQADLTKTFNLHFGTKRTRRQIESAVRNHRITCGRTGRFEKGLSPWNAGTKGLGLTGRNKTSFQKGNAPPNRKPIGSERISKDGYIEIKIAERNPYTGFPTRYKHKHVYIYEQHYGPVPNGYAVIFRDGNFRNFDPENLIAVSRAELLRLNKYRYKDAPDEIKPSLMALAKLEVKTFETKKTERQGGEADEKNFRGASARAGDEVA